MRALEIFDTDENGKLGGSLAEILRLADPPASRLVWTLRYIEARDDVSAAWPAISPLRDPVFYVAGPPPMLEALTGQLLALDVAPERIKIDAWE